MRVHTAQHVYHRLVLVGVAVLLAVVVPMAVAANNDFVLVDWPVSNSNVANAGDYDALIASAGLSTYGCCFTTGWIGPNLHQLEHDSNGNPIIGSAQFSQVGTLTQSNQRFWFVYAEPGVTCLRGQSFMNGLGCMGSPDDLTTNGEWTRYELVTYGQGFWIARVYDQNSNGHDVAKIYSSSGTIYRMENAGEEGWDASQTGGIDPYITMQYSQYHIEYKNPGQPFQLWPGPGAGTTQGYPCPYKYGADINLAGDSRYWYSGDGRTQCQFSLS